jgi:Zn-dependent peptidase ImmA (M78 family)
MGEFATFGDQRRFEIAVRWTRDAEPRLRRPATHGWSMGDLRITVANRVLTRSSRGGAQQDHVGWYLAPFFTWLASNWAALLHEEDFAWPERSGAPAVVACHRALDQNISMRDAEGRARYRKTQAWYHRHALRNAAEGGLFPDLFIRRFVDDIELSWSAQAPLFAPDGFSFLAEPGVARLPVDDVAGPLWETLTWVASNPPQLHSADHKLWQELVSKIDDIPKLSAPSLDQAYVNERILDMVRASLERIGRLELADEDVTSEKPYVRELAPAVAMFGGVSPNLGQEDVDFLCVLLAEKANGGDSDTLDELVADKTGAPLGIPHEDGYAFAEDFLENVGLPGNQDWIDIRSIVGQLGIEVLERTLETDSIRGVALAGCGVTPTILVNSTSPFNLTENGKRFTLAHELCHVLYDRSRARRVTHVSGPWVAPGIERRANAFAAYLLMPRSLVARGWQHHFEASRAEFEAFASRLHVNETALIEHLYNLDLIDELARERLRSEFRFH